jgi:hypothetical protein
MLACASGAAQRNDKATAFEDTSAELPQGHCQTASPPSAPSNTCSGLSFLERMLSQLRSSNTYAQDLHRGPDWSAGDTAGTPRKAEGIRLSAKETSRDRCPHGPTCAARAAPTRKS